MIFRKMINEKREENVTAWLNLSNAPGDLTTVESNLRRSHDSRE